MQLTADLKILKTPPVTEDGFWYTLFLKKRYPVSSTLPELLYTIEQQRRPHAYQQGSIKRCLRSAKFRASV